MDKDIIPLTATSTLERVRHIRQRKMIQRILDRDTSIMIEDPLDNEMILNMGPQHPATHGVLRVLLKVDGETVVRCIPELGYLHRGFEKLAENMTYHEFIPHTDRLDYISPMSNNVAVTLAFEKLAGIEVPERAQWIRMLVCEMARISSHLLAMGCTAMDVGALTVFIWTFAEREKLYDLFEEICGARFTTSYSRIGGVANDLDSTLLKKIRTWLNEFPTKLAQSEGLVMKNRIFIDRMAGVGYLPRDKAIALGVTGPCLRASGVDYDLRRRKPYLQYSKVDFDVITDTDGDSWARFRVRCAEMRESTKILHQVIDMLEVLKGPVMANNPKHVAPRKAEIYTRMEELINDFILVNFGTMPPKGEVYSSIESSKGELGFYVVSDGSGQPWKCKIKSPSATNLQALQYMAEGSMISDVVAIIGSIDPVMGEADK
ncbi:MAG: NADH dehydrogenase (quinone) subunit D [Bacteroidota bacterium]|nr:NADH dehydrogenase (quinone) subunit D [Candidatus Kapabacteria bacterium]MDW8219752.1 NADH dehydrogenase (quinone) subunit D [Bacteroidota bacterium]